MTKIPLLPRVAPKRRGATSPERVCKMLESAAASIQETVARDPWFIDYSPELRDLARRAAIGDLDLSDMPDGTHVIVWLESRGFDIRAQAYRRTGRTPPPMPVEVAPGVFRAPCGIVISVRPTNPWRRA